MTADYNRRGPPSIANREPTPCWCGEIAFLPLYSLSLSFSETIGEWGTRGRRTGCGCHEPLGCLDRGVSQALPRAAESPHTSFSTRFSKVAQGYYHFHLTLSPFCSHLVCQYCHPHSEPEELVRAWRSIASSPLLCSGPDPISWLSGKLILALPPSPKKLIRCLRRCVTTQCFFGSSNTIFCKSCSTTEWPFHQPRFLWIEALLWHISSGQDVRWRLL